MAISVTMNPSCLSISSPSNSLEHRRRNRKQSDLSEDSGSSGGGGRSSRKNKPKTAGTAAGGTKKLPQRGLGVAQLEKLRIQEQQRQQQQNLSSYAAATIPFLNSSWAGAAAPGLGFSMSSFMESGSELLVPPAHMRTSPDDLPNMKSCSTGAASFARTHNNNNLVVDSCASATAIATASASASTWRKSPNRLLVSLSSAPIFIHPDFQEVPRQAAGGTSKELSSFQNVVCRGESDLNFLAASEVKKKRSRDFEEKEEEGDDSRAEVALCQQFFPLTTAAAPCKPSQSVSDHENPYSRAQNSSGKGHGLGLKQDRNEDDDGLLALRLSAQYQRSQCHRQLHLWQQQQEPRFHQKITTTSPSCICSNLHVPAKDDKEKGKALAMEASKSKRSLSQPHANANAMFLRSSSAAASDSRLYSANTHSGRDHEDDLQLSLSLGLSL